MMSKMSRTCLHREADWHGHRSPLCHGPSYVQWVRRGLGVGLVDDVEVGETLAENECDMGWTKM